MNGEQAKDQDQEHTRFGWLKGWMDIHSRSCCVREDEGKLERANIMSRSNT